MPVRRDISVVIPLFNGGTYIEEALTSIADQSVRVGEIIVVDDGSTDNGASLAESHFARPRVVRQANRGPAA
ncbi:MAG: glycosyltransferase, partial [Pseudomonadota bacterium]